MYRKSRGISGIALSQTVRRFIAEDLSIDFRNHWNRATGSRRIGLQVQEPYARSLRPFPKPSIVFREIFQAVSTATELLCEIYPPISTKSELFREILQAVLTPSKLFREILLGETMVSRVLCEIFPPCGREISVYREYSALIRYICTVFMVSRA